MNRNDTTLSDIGLSKAHLAFNNTIQYFFFSSLTEIMGIL